MLDSPLSRLCEDRGHVVWRKIVHLEEALQVEVLARSNVDHALGEVELRLPDTHCRDDMVVQVCSGPLCWVWRGSV